MSLAIALVRIVIVKHVLRRHTHTHTHTFICRVADRIQTGYKHATVMQFSPCAGLTARWPTTNLVEIHKYKRKTHKK